MLLFESFSVGTIMVLIAIMAILLAVGLYGMFVWPLTMWDMAEVGTEKYLSWIKGILWSVFVGGSLGGFWCVSGAAFPVRARKSPPSARTSSGPRRS